MYHQIFKMFSTFLYHGYKSGKEENCHSLDKKRLVLKKINEIMRIQFAWSYIVVYLSLFLFLQIALSFFIVNSWYYTNQTLLMTVE